MYGKSMSSHIMDNRVSDQMITHQIRWFGCKVVMCWKLIESDCNTTVMPMMPLCVTTGSNTCYTIVTTHWCKCHTSGVLETGYHATQNRIPLKLRWLVVNHSKPRKLRQDLAPKEYSTDAFEFDSDSSVETSAVVERFSVDPRWMCG